MDWSPPEEMAEDAAWHRVRGSNAPVGNTEVAAGSGYFTQALPP